MRKRTKRVGAIVILLLAALLLYRYFVIPNLLYPTKYSEYVDRYSEEYELDKAVIYAVIKAESSFDADNRSRTGARGLMQIMPETGEWAAEVMGLNEYDAEKLYEPDTNIHIGCWYLRYLLDMYDGKLSAALAAYNAGLGNVSKWLVNPEYSSDGNTLDVVPYKETDGYVEKTLKYMEKYNKYYEEL